MSDDAPSQGGPFDLDRVQTLLELMEKHGLSEISLRRGDEHWRFRRGPDAPLMPPGYMPYGQLPTAAPAAAASQGAPAPAAPAGDPAASGVFIKSPVVGTYYQAPTPDDPPFVGVGSKVSPESVVCLVEAMKVFNQIQAEMSGTIVEILVKNGDAVEFNQKLFRVKPD